MTPSKMIYKDLVLIGGGHAHAQVIKMWAMNPVPGVRLTLVSPQVQSPYSGMLPGLITGHYSFDETHIDLLRLCQYAGVRFIQASVERLDLHNKSITLSASPSLSNEKENRPDIHFDLLSINSGITPDLSIKGAAEHAIPVKPISDFYPRWQATLTALRDSAKKESNIHVVGGGAAGVELVLAMQYAVSQDPSITAKVNFSLVFRGPEITMGYRPSMRKKVERILSEKEITFYSDCDVHRIKSDALTFSDGRAPLISDHTFWCTNASAPLWPKTAGLATNENGFIALNDSLQSTSHDFVFAAGDVAQQINYPRPHAGVFAVRQGPVLFKNLQRQLLNRNLLTHKPQEYFLSLLACGDKSALGHKPFWPNLEGRWVWRWKDKIDRRFMAMFSDLSPIEMKDNIHVDPVISGDETPKDISTIAMRCGGCGAKVGATVLSRVINQLQPIKRDDVLLGLDSPDDAAAITVNGSDNMVLLQSVDVFRAFMDEPYLLGKIAAEHALSDLFAMNAAPQSAMAIATLPFAGEKITERDLMQIMSGALHVLNQNNCELTGGHTSEGAELSIGFSVNGLASEEQLLKKSSVTADHVLVLTQALGTGALFAAHNLLQAQGRWIEQALAGMLLSNRRAGEIFSRHQASACTDVTGFGLLGHLVEMLKPCGLNATLEIHTIPALDGALECLEQGIASSLQPQNVRLRRAIQNQDAWRNTARYQLLFDPQTSGGLLASIPQENSAQCLSELKAAGYPQAVIIGKISSDNSDDAPIRLQ